MRALSKLSKLVGKIKEARLFPEIDKKPTSLRNRRARSSHDREIFAQRRRAERAKKRKDERALAKAVPALNPRVGNASGVNAEAVSVKRITKTVSKASASLANASSTPRCLDLDDDLALFWASNPSNNEPSKKSGSLGGRSPTYHSLLDEIPEDEESESQIEAKLNALRQQQKQRALNSLKGFPEPQPGKMSGRHDSAELNTLLEQQRKCASNSHPAFFQPGGAFDKAYQADMNLLDDLVQSMGRQVSRFVDRDATLNDEIDPEIGAILAAPGDWPKLTSEQMAATLSEFGIAYSSLESIDSLHAQNKRDAYRASSDDPLMGPQDASLDSNFGAYIDAEIEALMNEDLDSGGKGLTPDELKAVLKELNIAG